MIIANCGGRWLLLLVRLSIGDIFFAIIIDMKWSRSVPVEAFCGLYWRDRNWQKYVCPPYDVIPVGQEKRYQKLSPYNIVRLELPARIFKNNPYQQAGRLFQRWRKKKVLISSRRPAFYLVEETFQQQKRRLRRRGFFGLFNLATKIYRHEKTLTAPRIDRRLCLTNIRANTSAVFILVENKKVKNLLASGTGQLMSRFQFNGVRYVIREISEPDEIVRWQQVLQKSNFYVADGHHRLATAKRFGARYVLGYFVPTDSPGLVILPTHRVVSYSPELMARQKKYFRPAPATRAIFSVYHRGRLTGMNLANRYRPENKLPAEILKKFLLKDIPAEKIIYSHSDEEARKLAKSRGLVAYILPPTPLKIVLRYSRRGKVLPPKSTYFYPKIIAGLVIYAYDR